MIYVGQHVRVSNSGVLVTDRRLWNVEGVVVRIYGRIGQRVDVLFAGDEMPTTLQAMFIEPVAAGDEAVTEFPH
jgi:hypothetical protein